MASSIVVPLGRLGGGWRVASIALALFALGMLGVTGRGLLEHRTAADAATTTATATPPAATSASVAPTPSTLAPPPATAAIPLAPTADGGGAATLTTATATAKAPDRTSTPFAHALPRHAPPGASTAAAGPGRAADDAREKSRPGDDLGAAPITDPSLAKASKPVAPDGSSAPAASSAPRKRPAADF